MQKFRFGRFNAITTACALGAIFAAPTTCVFAQTLSGEELRVFVAGKTVHLDSPIGTLPVTYNPNGTLSGKTGNLALAAYLGSQTDRGRWEVQGNKICQKFFRWLHGEMSCATFRMDGRKISWRRDDGLAGTATIASNDAEPPPTAAGLGLRPEAVVRTTSERAPTEETLPSQQTPRKAPETVQRPAAMASAGAGAAFAPKLEARRPVQAPNVQAAPVQAAPVQAAPVQAAAVTPAKPKPVPEPARAVETADDPVLEVAPKVVARSVPVRAELVPTAGFAVRSATTSSGILTREVRAERETFDWCAEQSAEQVVMDASGKCFMAIPGLADMAKRVHMSE